ncbi:carbohydrate ABC transporter permease [Anaeromicropila populeti]|uniref:ABC-type glycerol-3-phosphate transport system, permease component n=1 Tax=Anaeromicropila populeti TaxID=37658 RepID=A0A1I6LPP9_9FIRM|nr:carbohydrate ABC transporter permease [Anaeromicropila populeti]SFS05232.1 ABC-type glycerol-3-phosphate transport system, permease component [Anaeromicropila populeti]
MAGYKGSNINPQKFERGQLKIIIAILPLALFMLLPIIFIICHAFKPMDELFAFPPKFFVSRPTLDNFTKLMKASQTSGIPLSRYVFNSILVTIAVVGGSILLSTMSGFALSKLKFKGKFAIMEVNNMALMFVPVAVMIPRYLTINVLGLTDTYLAHVLPLLAMPVSLFLVKQFIDQVPDALIEAAYMDGAGDLRVYFKIIIPLIKPAIATSAILAFQQVWINVESSNLYVSSEGFKTLAFYMNSLASANNTVAGQGVAAAAGLIMFIPNFLLFIVLQKSMMNTMAHSGIK